MSRAARSLRIFGIYLVALGGILIGSPNTLLSLVRLAPTSEPWIHVMGVAVMGMGMLFMAAARVEVPGFIRATVWIRVFALVAMAALVLARVAPPVVLLFGLVDAAAAAWTYISLRQELSVDPALSRETV
jgi:hypothetical protein